MAFNHRRGAAYLRSRVNFQSAIVAHSVTYSLLDIVAMRAHSRRTNISITTIERVVMKAMSIEPVAEFISGYLAQRSPTSVLDPYAGTGELVSSVVARLKSPARVTAISSTPTNDSATTWIEADSIDWLSNCDERFDAVVCLPAIEGKRKRITIEDWSVRVRVLARPDEEILLRSSFRLTDGGTGIFVVPPSVVRRHPDSALRKLRELGLRLKAFISVPSRGKSQVPLALVIIEPGEQSKIYVGELAGADHNRTLLKNLIAWTESETSSLGFLTDFGCFRGFEAACADRRSKGLAEGVGCDPVLLSDIAEVNTLNPRGDIRFNRKPNAVYIPLYVGKPAVTSLKDLALPQTHYVQVILDPHKAKAEYVAASLNTPLGKAIRAAASSRAGGRLLNPSDVRELPCFLPSVEQQTVVAQTRSEIAEQLEDIHGEIWRRPEILQKCVNSVPESSKDLLENNFGLHEDAKRLLSEKPNDHSAFIEWCMSCRNLLEVFAYDEAEGKYSDEIREWSGMIAKRSQVHLIKVGGREVAKALDCSIQMDPLSALLTICSCIEWRERNNAQMVTQPKESWREKEARALGLLFKNPTWTKKSIAKEVGVSDRTLYNWTDFQQAWVWNKTKDTGKLARGWKTAERTIEAFKTEQCSICGQAEAIAGEPHCYDCFMEDVEREHKVSEKLDKQFDPTVFG